MSNNDQLKTSYDKESASKREYPKREYLTMKEAFAKAEREKGDTTK